MPEAPSLAWLAERCPELQHSLDQASPAVQASAARVLAASDFVRDALNRDGQLRQQLLQRDGLAATRVSAPALPPSPAAAAEADFMAQLRRWRRLEFVRIAWRDLAGWDDLQQTLAQLSDAADHALRAAHDFAWQALTAVHGVPRDEAGEAQQLLIIAMGKLGGGELNFSSDIDLVFLYTRQGETDGAQRLGNDEFFLRLGRTIIRLLDPVTADGFVFRVDMRLRPFGDSGPLVASVAALEDYLQLQGRDWERYAWVKARAVVGEEAYRTLWRQIVRPFVYRRYLDFGVFESLREMKALIEREVVRRDLQDNIKLGEGGIREIEFVVQALQLIRGGQDPRLQTVSLLRALQALGATRLLPGAAGAELQAAYVFLRRLENRLQMRTDSQTHELPATPAARAQIAAAMDCADWDALRAQLEAQRQRVSAHFQAIIFSGGAAPGTRAADAATTAAGAVLADWPRPEATPGEWLEPLRALGYADAQSAAQVLRDLAASTFLRRLDDTGQRRLRQLLPVLVAEAGQGPQPLEALRHLLRIVEAIGARSAYFALLLEHHAARRRLVELARHGEFLTAQIAAHPLLLDELLKDRLVDELPTREELQQELAQKLALVEDDDEERLAEQLRHFQRAALFRYAVADLAGELPVMRVSDRLTELAELILAAAMRMAWQSLVRQLGTPMCGEGAARREVKLCAVGYGKLGGIELGYASDLDLVFLHDSTGEHQETAGARSVENQVFFVRYVQRLVHVLTMHSAAGRLYEVDMRLRPSGKGGMLITSIGAFAEYQRREAWSWEHQALLHARGVAGDPALLARFEAVRLAALSQHVKLASLREDVRHMRQRMRDELSKAGAGEVDLKQDPGGVADIEFLAQYWALRWVGDYPPVAHFSDTIRQLESVASADLVPQADIDVLTGAYRAYRELIHHRALDGAGPVVPDTVFRTERAAVIAIWDRTMTL